MFWRAFREVWRNPYVRVAVALLALAALFVFLRWSGRVWGTVVIAYLVAFILDPVVGFFQRRRLPRSVAVLIVSLLIVGVLVGLWFLGILIAAQLSLFAEQVPALIETLEEIPFLVARRIDGSYGSTFQQVFVNLYAFEQDLVTRVLPSLGSVQSRVFERFGLWTTTGIQLFAIFALSIYLLYSLPRYNRSFLLAFPPRRRAGAQEVLEYLGTAVGSYVRGQLLIATIVGVLTGIGMAVLGVPLAPALGLLAGVGNLIPFIGPLLATVPAVILALTESWLTALLAVGLLLLVQLLDANVLTPQVYSRVISLDPVTVIVAVLFGALLLGVWGAVVAVPAAVFLTLLYRRYYLDSPWYRGEARAGPEPPERASGDAHGPAEMR